MPRRLIVESEFRLTCPVANPILLPLNSSTKAA